MNHSYDYGYEGILSTIRVLNDAGFAHAGIGRDLDHATFPGFLQTPKGTVAIVSAYAGDDYLFQLALNPTASGSFGKPGVNGVRVDFVLDPTTWESLRSTFQSLGLRANNYPWLRDQFGGETLELKGHYYFVKGNEPGTYVRTQPRKQDLDRNIRAVREAAGMADWVIFACHYHTPSTRFDEHGNPNPTEAVEILAKACLDAGADVVVGTGGGGGAYQGIEIYGSKPILWNLGVFIENVESMLRQPATIYEMMGLDQNAPIHVLHDRLNKRIWKRADKVPATLYWSGLLATIELVGGRGADCHVKEIKLHPCDLHGEKPRAVRGRPTMAGEEVANAVLEKLKYKSAQYGTEVKIKGGIGIIGR
jgi:poly-gamma-glutamate synthesis protein (capsule biosynthesis protein)